MLIYVCCKKRISFHSFVNSVFRVAATTQSLHVTPSQKAPAMRTISTRLLTVRIARAACVESTCLFWIS